MNILKKYLDNSKLKEVIKFFVTGVSAFVVDLSLVYFFTFIVFEGNDMLLIGFISVSKGLAAAISLQVSFLLNRIWTFKASDKRTLPQVVKFLFINLFNFGYAVVLFSFFSFTLTELGVPNAIEPGISNFLTESVKMVTTFFFYKYFVFK
jgi:putative flippase GtrA